MTDEYKSNILPGAPGLGPPASHFLGVWVGAPEDEAVEWYDELDASRWSIRCVREFRDGSLKAHSYASADWRDTMPDQPLPPLEEINENADLEALFPQSSDCMAAPVCPTRQSKNWSMNLLAGVMSFYSSTALPRVAYSTPALVQFWISSASAGRMSMVPWPSWQARPSSTHNVWPQSASRKVVWSPSWWQTKFHSSYSAVQAI
jgi:hypothetical protein